MPFFVVQNVILIILLDFGCDNLYYLSSVEKHLSKIDLMEKVHFIPLIESITLFG